MVQLFIIAIRNLLQNSKRTFLLGGAISGVTALLVFLICLSSGVRSTMLESATTVMTGHINVGGFYKVTAGQSAPLVIQYNKVTEVIRHTLPDLDYVVARGRGWARVVSDTGSMQLGLGGIDISNEPGLKKTIHILEGKLEDLAQPNSMMLFAEQAKKLDVHVGDSLIVSVLTARGVNNTIDVHVVAIAQDMGLLSSFNSFMPVVSLRQLYQLNSDSTGALLVYVKDMKRIPEDMEKLRKALSDQGYLLMDRDAKPFWFKFESVNREDWTGQKLDTTTWEEEISFIRWTVSAIDGLTFILSVVLLTIISIGIMNSMWIAIRERTREIGTLRAIGMQRLRVLSMFMIEAFTLATIGSVVGTVIGLVLAVLINAGHFGVPKAAGFFLMSNTVRLAFDFGRIIQGMLVITGCTTLIAVIPSTHAARMKPITAMQHIG